MLNAIKRFLIVFLGIVWQFGFSIIIRLFFYEHFSLITLFYNIVSILIVLALLKESTHLSNDLPWIILILIFPIFGTLLFLTLGRNYSRNKLLRNILKKEEEYAKFLVQDQEVKKEIEEKKLDNISYLLNRSAFTVSKNNELSYYNFGEKFYPELLAELKKAKRYIFMEYFIVNEGQMWGGILDILKEKAAAGLDVRLIYDDMGSVAMLSTNYPKELAKFGIKCIPFNKLSPFRGIFMNNRDHRKMTIIDGEVAFSGGVNLSDEYINVGSKYGIWKDNGIKIVGDGIWNLTVMFLTMWNANLETDADISVFRHDFAGMNETSENASRSKGYVIPYGLGPFHADLLGEDVYINMINSAKDYLYIMTPYLIIDTDMVNSLARAAKRGVDVRIVVPGIPDKKIVYTLTTSFFRVLHESGVKIYKFSPGFVHSKVFLSDDVRAVVGTINMDYRSLYLHFENGIYMEGNSEIQELAADFKETFKDCKKLDDRDVKAGFIKGLWQAILRLLAPLF